LVFVIDQVFKISMKAENIQSIGFITGFLDDPVLRC